MSFINPIAEVHDQCTYSNYTEVVTESLHLDFFINFDKKIIEGETTLEMRALKDGLQVVYLDSWDLKIMEVVKDGTGLKFELEDPSNMAGEIGECLRIDLPEAVMKDQVFKIVVKYETTEKSTALNFLSAEQTLEK
jgi:leukotriene-A4 hydrolase